MGLFKKIFGGLKKTANAISSKISQIFTKELNDDFYDDLEDVLISSDIGFASTQKIIADIKQVAKQEKIKTEAELKLALSQSIASLLQTQKPIEFTSPTVILVVGVNGVGKTTSIGKVANYFKRQNKSVMLIAGDTFRAAAADQLTEWSKRAGVRIVRQDEGADPASVVYDGLASAKAKGEDIVLIDTAGRLHNKAHLMEELKKIDRIVEKVYQQAKYLKLLVIDATTGQNALSQVEYFNTAVNIDALVLTKVDGTAKGGVVVAINQEQHMPVAFLGVGEAMEDLEEFDAQSFASALIGLDEN